VTGAISNAIKTVLYKPVITIKDTVIAIIHKQLFLALRLQQQAFTRRDRKTNTTFRR